VAPAAVPGAAQIAKEAPAVLQQAAGVAPGALGRSGSWIFNNSPKLMAGVAGLYGAEKLYEGISRNWRRSPEDSALIYQMQNDPTNVEGVTTQIQQRERDRRARALTDMHVQYADAQAMQNQMRSMSGRQGSPYGFVS
jgi:hypothetical protein